MLILKIIHHSGSGNRMCLKRFKIATKSKELATITVQQKKSHNKCSF